MPEIELAKPKAILFDWDNTLVETWPCIGRAMNITLEAMGQPIWTPAVIKIRVAGSLRDTFPALFGARWEEAREVFYKAFAELHLEMLVTMAGAEDLLREVAAAGIYLGVVSNKTGKYLRAEAKHLDWTGLFGRLVGAQDAARDKPAADPIHLALEPSGIKAGPDVWFVGDAPIDVECGQGAGCRTVFVGKAYVTEPNLCQPDRIVADCKALAALIRSASPRN